MTIINRIIYLIKSKMNTTLDDFENPVEMLDQKIKDMECILNQARFSSAKILGNAHEIGRRLETLTKESDEYVQNIKLALDKGNEELAKKILIKKLDNDKYFESLNTSFNNANTNGESLKFKLRELEHNIYETKIYRNDAFARYNTAEAHKKINDIMGNISTKSNFMPLSDIERVIERKECFLLGLTELDFRNDLINEVANLTFLDLNLELKKYM